MPKKSNDMDAFPSLKKGRHVVPGNRQTKKDVIVEELRRMVASGVIERGARIQQDALAERFATSITPVREALRQLEAEGLFVSEPHRGVRVADVNLEALKGTYIMRRLVEPYAAQRAVLRVSRQDIQKLRDQVETMREAHEAGDGNGVRQANLDFHFIIYNRCGIPSLVTAIQNLWVSFPWDLLQIISSRVEESIAEHRQVLKAFEKGDAERIREKMDRHIQKSFLSLARYLSGKSVDDPFDFETD